MKLLLWLCLPAFASGVEWVRIPEGSFLMGSDSGNPSEKPVHEVRVKAFELAKTEVTNKQYQACVDAGACAPAHISDGTCIVVNQGKPVETSTAPHHHDEEDGGFAHGNLPASFLGDDQPVVCVDWEQARAFSAWAGGRLPTEAEWEYAARSAGKPRAYPWGDEEASCDRAVMISDDRKSYGCGRNATWPVCSKPAGNTDQGLCDMAGNASEWVADVFHDSYSGAPSDGSAWETPPGPRRVARSGSWRYESAFARAANRCDPGFRSFAFLGFRPAKGPGRPPHRSPAGMRPRSEEGPVPSDIDSPPRLRPEPRPRAFAVMVGAGARYAAKDAVLVSRYLTQVLGFKSENTALALEGAATRDRLDELFSVWLPSRTAPGDEVFVYFAGPGFPDKEVFTRLAVLPAGRITVVLDCAAAGDLPGPLPSNMVVFSASAQGQAGRTYEDKGHRLFTYFLLRGLRRLGTDLDSVFEHAATEVDKTSRREFNAGQTPQRRDGREAGPRP